MLKGTGTIDGAWLQQAMQKFSERLQHWVECHGRRLELTLFSN
jgi:hypothetical protein